MKKLIKALLFPHIAVMIILIPVAVTFLTYSMLFLESDSVISIVSYVISAYTLTVWCLKTPKIIAFIKNFKDENKYARRWLDDERLRVKTSLYGSLLWNTAYAIFQLWLGFYHESFWYCSLAGYYISLAIMRFFLVRYTARNLPGKEMRRELVRYRACGWVLLVMNLSLSLMIFFMVYWGRTFEHHEVTAIAMAAYTFTAFTTAIVNVIKYKKYNSPIYSAAKAISFAAACVSMLTLESTLLTTFGDATTDAATQKIMLGASGVVISLFIVLMAVYMIVKSTNKLNVMGEGNGKQ